MYRTRWSRPPSQPGRPSTVIPLRRRSVACWFASSRLGAPILVRALTAWSRRFWVSQGSPPGPRLRTLIWLRSRSVRNTSENEVLPDKAGSVGTNASDGAPSRWVQPMPLSWSISGFSTCVYSGPSAISPSLHALQPPVRHPHPPRQQIIHQPLFKRAKLVNLGMQHSHLSSEPGVDFDYTSNSL